MSAIKLLNVRKEYKHGTMALRSINLSIEQGEFVAITGASGSGKSTLMNMIGCLDIPTSGEIKIFGRRLNDLNRQELADFRCNTVGFVFQKYNLLSHLTNMENILLPVRYSGVKDDGESKVREIAQKLGVKDKLECRPCDLSGGQQQRVSIVRALISDAPIILADEPTGALDKENSENIIKTLRKLHSEGKTIIIVTHDNDIANSADRIISLSDGEIIKDEIKTVNTPAHPTINLAYNKRSFLRTFSDIMKMSFDMLKINRLRSILTMLGVIIGVFSVIISSAVTEGVKENVVRKIESLGGGVEIRSGLTWSENISNKVQSLKISDSYILNQLPGVEKSTYFLELIKNYTAGKDDVSIRLLGTTDNFFKIKKMKIIQGRFFDAYDNKNSQPVAVISDKDLGLLGYENTSNVIGNVLTIDGIALKIIGVVNDPTSENHGGMANIYMPYNTLSIRFGKINHITSLLFSIKKGGVYDDIIRHAEKLISIAHGERDFFIWSNRGLINTSEYTSLSFRNLITAIAGISLLVAGIGVMNIMLMNVTERMGEIGIRQALGARPSDIMLQFLFESVIICMLGTVVGILLSLLVAQLSVYFFDDSRLIITESIVFLSCLVSCFTGLLFGWYPALSASRLSPVTALMKL